MALFDRVGWAREAIIYEPTWPSAQAAQITEILPLTGITLQTGITQQFVVNTDQTTVGYIDAVGTEADPNFNLSLELRYEGLESLIACAMGFETLWLETTHMPEEIERGVYRHLFEMDTLLSARIPWKKDIEGVYEADVQPNQMRVRRGTLAAMREFNVWEYLSCMVSQMNIDFDVESSHLNVNCFAYQLRRNSFVNTIDSMKQAMINPTPRIQFHHGIMRLAPHSAIVPLTDENHIQTMTWNCTLQNFLHIDHAPGRGEFAEEFERNTTPLLSGSFNLPRYMNNMLPDAWRDHRRFMMDFKCTGPIINRWSEQRYQFNVYVPGLFFTQVEPTGPSERRANMPAQWIGATTNPYPAGFPLTNKKGTLVVEIVNSNSRHQFL